MYLVFVDECGYQKDWKKPKNIQQQPVHVVAAVAIDSNDIGQVYETMRNEVKKLQLPRTNADALGKGEEIKASSIDKGEGFWGENQQLREEVRRIYLDHQQAIYFVVFVDKDRHAKTYSTPENPADLALKFVLERIQGFVREKRQKALVLIDSNKREEPAQRSTLFRLILMGSTGFGVSRFYGTFYKWKLEMANILEIHFGDSKYSLGLQIADFVARHTYSWWKNGKQPNYPGWSFIEPRLWKYPDHRGWGYKEFPLTEDV